MERPKIYIKPTGFDYLLEVLAALSLLSLFLIPLWYYQDLPETIPRHFNGRGEPDGEGGKGIFLIIPVVGLVLYAGITWLNRYPHLFNYPVAITPANAEFQYRNALRLMRVLKAVITFLFAFIVYRIGEVAMGRAEGLGGAFTPVVLTLTFGATFYFLFRSLSK